MTGKRPSVFGALMKGQPGGGRLQWYPPPARTYSLRELLADRVVNFTMAVLSWTAAIALSYVSWAAGDSATKQLGFVLHGLGLIAMTNGSAVFHYYSCDAGLARRFYAVDQLGINMMIVGCYAPIMQQCGMYQTLAFVCVLGGLGVLQELRYAMNSKLVRNNEGFTLNDARFLLMGWAGYPALTALSEEFSAGVMQTVLAGGLFYTVGLGVLLAKSFEFHQAIWHAMVMVGSSCFYAVNIGVLTGSGTG